MNRKKTYVSPQVTRVKLEPTQAVLSQCAVGTTDVQSADTTGVCNTPHNCKQAGHWGGDNAATS